MSSPSNSHARWCSPGLCRALITTLALAMSTAPALAQPNQAQAKAKAKAIYNKGRTQFDLGNFEQAIELFKQAYETWPNEAILFNIAQAYRQMGNCKEALFFYKRYLTVAGPDGRNSDQARAHINDLTESCKVIDEMKNQEPLGTVEPSEGDGQKVGQGTAGNSNAPGNTGETGLGVGSGVQGSDNQPSTDVGTVTDEARPATPSLIASTFEIGPAFLGMGDLKITGAHFSLSLGAGYPISLDKLGLSVGALFTFTPVPWSNEQTAAEGTSTLSTLLFNVGARYWVMDKLAIRAEVGAGALFLGGLSEGNVFVPPGNMASGVLTMPNVRVGVGAEYLITDNIVLSASPFVYSFSGAKEGLREEIDAFTRIELMAGIGYRL